MVGRSSTPTLDFENRLRKKTDLEVIQGFALRMIDWSYRYYEDGIAGLPYLPIRARFAVGAARWIYGEIGEDVRRLGTHAWDQRVGFGRRER